MPYVDVGTHRLWVEDDGQGEPVVLLHSLFFDRRMYEPILDELADEHRVLRVDVRDHGRSDGPAARWGLGEAARELERVADELDLGPVHVAGVSMGGMLAMRWALAHPERVRSLGLMSTSPEPEVRPRLHKAMAYAVRFGGRRVMEALLGYTLDQMFAEPVRSSAEADRWAERIAESDPERLFRAGLAVFDRASIVDRLDRIDAPALVMVGGEDAAIPPTHGARLAERLPEATLVEVPGVGHMLPIEAPGAVAEELSGFLDRPEASDKKASKA